MVLMQRSSIVGDEAVRTSIEPVSEGAMGVNHVAFDVLFWVTGVNAGRASWLQRSGNVGNDWIEQAPSRSW